MIAEPDLRQQKPPAIKGDRGDFHGNLTGSEDVFIAPIPQEIYAPAWCRMVRAGLAGDVRAGVLGYRSLKRWSRREGINR